MAGAAREIENTSNWHPQKIFIILDIQTKKLQLSYYNIYI